MNIDINVRFGLSHALHQFLETKLMATLADFTALLDKLEADVAAHNQADAAVVTDLNNQIAALKDQVANAGMPASDEQALFDRLKAVDDSFAPPAPPTPTPTPEPAPEPTPEPTPEPPVSA